MENSCLENHFVPILLKNVRHLTLPTLYNMVVVTIGTYICHVHIYRNMCVSQKLEFVHTDSICLCASLAQ